MIFLVLRVKKIWIITTLIFLVSSIILITTKIFASENEEKKYIKWFDFNAEYDVLDKTSKLDISSHVNNEQIKYNWIELISYLACKHGGNLSNFKESELTALVEQLKSRKNYGRINKRFKILFILL